MIRKMLCPSHQLECAFKLCSIPENQKPQTYTCKVNQINIKENIGCQKGHKVWKTIAQKTMDRLSSRGWLPNLVIGVAFLLISPVIGGIMQHPRVAIISAAIGLTIIVWVVAWAAYRGIPASMPSNVIHDNLSSSNSTIASKTDQGEQKILSQKPDTHMTNQDIKRGSPSKSLHTPLPQTAFIKSSPGSTVYQAGRDLIVNPSPVTSECRISSLILEVRLTCLLKEAHGELPPDEVGFLPVGDANAYLEGPAGRQRLIFSSPIRFMKLADGKIIIINRFAIDPAGDLINQPARTLVNYEKIIVPVITIGGKDLLKFTLLEISLSLNGQYTAYGRWPYDVPFQEGPMFTVAFESLRNQLLSSPSK